MLTRCFSWGVPIVLLLAGACAGNADENELTGTGGPGSGSGGADTRHHPEPNGVHVSETDACAALEDVLRSKALALGCSKTVRACPGLLRTDYDPDCMQYDQGTVSGCVDYFQGQSTCEGLVETDCVLIGYPETAPSGCP